MPLEFEQFYLKCLAHASYLIGSEGVAAVIDPQRDVDVYIDEAVRRGLRIGYVIETHLHADFVSGHSELARRTGATILIGAKAQAKFRHSGVTDGMELALGKMRMLFRETPGHTVESISVVVFRDGEDQPWAVFTGDTLFIGDVGRPDLSETFSARELASMLYDSLHEKVLTLPDSTVVYPAHGAGSLCGRQMSSELSSTIGIQKQVNYALRARSKDEFVDLVTVDLPDRPGYFSRDAELNRRGAAPLAEKAVIPSLSPEEFLELMDKGVLVLDTRPAGEFLAAHVPNSVNVALTGQFASWAGTVLGVDTPLLLVAEDDEKVEETRLRLARVGLDHHVGVLAGGIQAWEGAGLPLARIPQISVAELQARLDEFEVWDVRRAAEVQLGTIKGAVHMPLDGLSRRLDASVHGRPVAVYCQGGYRSAIASSLMRRAGYTGVINVEGGFGAWVALGLPVEGV